MRLIWHLKVYFPLPILNTGNLPTYQASHPEPRGGERGRETAFPDGTEPALRRGLIDNPLGLFSFIHIFKVLNFRKIAFLTSDMASHGFIRSVQTAQKASSQLVKKRFVWRLRWPFTRHPLPIPTSWTHAEAAGSRTAHIQLAGHTTGEGWAKPSPHYRNLQMLLWPTPR